MQRNHRIRSLLTLALGVALLPAVPASGDATPGAAARNGLGLVPIRNARVPMDGVLSGGQPTREQVEAALRAGFRTVINLRGADEPGFEWEREAVEAAGARYVHVPVSGADGLARENIESIDRALREALEAGPVLLHCASGNRIGAVLALRAAWVEGRDAEEALAFGRAAGLTGLEGTTRELLGLAAPEPAKSE